MGSEGIDAANGLTKTENLVASDRKRHHCAQYAEVLGMDLYRTNTRSDTSEPEGLGRQFLRRADPLLIPWLLEANLWSWRRPVEDLANLPLFDSFSLRLAQRRSSFLLLELFASLPRRSPLDFLDVAGRALPSVCSGSLTCVRADSAVDNFAGDSRSPLPPPSGPSQLSG
ncbi:hypothetical protein P170DRAFT_479802 [Aspergillus steynii IBT 23096]|uniref:Uncharacterized protein n=1 Tax=Aspergillus steynii IBT 23096 TaxID=1392250 RepID=A0A2I2FXC3_9EURO|nr:uncharacterized protein P170DRAFT_479802 [Aspergillus steynii IBT 23096]PLB45285.1 hypothetical protein P170DRAFT_479802 [Aspergillus steynii IBT 23096]